MRRLKAWVARQLIKRQVRLYLRDQRRRQRITRQEEKSAMQKFIAVLNAIKNPKTSEFWMTWGTILIATVSKFVPGADIAIGATAGAFGIDPSALVGGSIAYIVGRLSNKAANA